MDSIIAAHLRNIEEWQSLSLLFDSLPCHVNEEWNTKEIRICNKLIAEYEVTLEDYLQRALAERGLVNFKPVIKTIIYLPGIKYTIILTDNNLEIIYNTRLFIHRNNETIFYYRNGFYLKNVGNNFIYSNEQITLNFSYPNMTLNNYSVKDISRDTLKVIDNKFLFNDELVKTSSSFKFNNKYKGYIRIRSDGSIESIFVTDGKEYHILKLEFYSNGVVKSLFSYLHGVLDGPFITIDEQGNMTEGYYEKNLLVGYFKNNIEKGNLKIINGQSYKVGIWYEKGVRVNYPDYAERFYPTVTLK